MKMRAGIAAVAALVSILSFAAVAAGEDVSRTVVGNDSFVFEPGTLTFNEGDQVTVTFQNPGSIPHTFTIDELGVDIRLAAGESGSATFTASSPGTYSFYCAEPGHRNAGMEGALVVKGPSEPTTPGFEFAAAILALAIVVMGYRLQARPS